MLSERCRSLRSHNLFGQTLTESDKMFIINENIKANQQPSDIAIKYNIPLHRVNKYIRKNKNGLSLSSTNGRATLINDKEQDKLLNIFQGTTATRKEDLGGIMLQSNQNTCIDRGQSSIQVKNYWLGHKYWLLTNMNSEAFQ